MKLLLGALLGFAIAGSPLLAGQEPGDKEKQKQEEPKKQEPQPKANPDKKQEPAPSAKQEKQDEKQQQTDKQQQKENQKQSKDQDKKTRENNPPQAQSQNRQQNNRQQYGQESHGKGERIPPQKFQADFGRDHHFRVKHLEQGRRFEYSGYSFELVQAWPADWSYDDECYIEQDTDGYYLVDLIHPEVRVLVIVV
jgi:hypothetical protein